MSETEEPHIIEWDVAPEISDKEFPVPSNILEWESENITPPPEEEPLP